MRHTRRLFLAALMGFAAVSGFASQSQPLPYPVPEEWPEEFQRLSDLPKLAKAALAHGEIDNAVNYANQMIAVGLREHPTLQERVLMGDMIYNGNYVLGMVAVKRGDINAAADYLLLSGYTPGSPLLKVLGPNMNLAKELLERGQKDTVLVFLKKCKRFWTPPAQGSRLYTAVERGYIEAGPDKWIQELEEGQTPNFGSNLSR